jgi:hypothetical protein
VRDIRAHLEDVYGLQVSPDLISRVTDAVLDEVREWQSRALDRMYPIVIFDALRVKICDADSRMVNNKAVYDRYVGGGFEALADRSPRPKSVWNRIPQDRRDNLIEFALEHDALDTRELAVKYTDEKRYFDLWIIGLPHSESC